VILRLFSSAPSPTGSTSTRCRSPGSRKSAKLSLAWLTLIGAAIGHTVAFALHARRVSCIALPETAQLWIHRFNHALISGVGPAGRVVRLFKLCPAQSHAHHAPALEINLAWLYASSVVGGILIAVLRAFANDDLAAAARRAPALTGIHSCCLRTVAIVFAVLILLSMPIVFCARRRRHRRGCWIGGLPDAAAFPRRWCPARRAGVLLAIPAFVFRRQSDGTLRP